jgi:hypothetical protein
VLGYASGSSTGVLGRGNVPACARFDPHLLRGHFAGSTVLYWAAGAGGRGALCTGDTLHVVEDHRYVTFMYGYVNYISLSGAEVRRITEQLVLFSYNRIYGCIAWWVVASDAQAAVATSATRYLRAIGDA